MGKIHKCKIDTKNILCLILTNTLLDNLVEKDLFNGLENLKLFCLKENLHKFSIVKDDFKEINFNYFKNMLKYIFEGTNIDLCIITERQLLRVNISLSFRKFRNFNQRNVIENNEYTEHNAMIFDSDGPIVCYLPLNLEQPNEILIKYDQKFKHLNELREDIEDNKIKLGEIVAKKFKDNHILFILQRKRMGQC